MTRLPRVGTVAYNGFKFPSTFNHTVSGVPIFDRSGRAVKYYQWTFRSEGVLVSEDLSLTGSPVTGAKIDDEMDVLRVRLTTPAKEFVFFDQGFGDLVVNKGFADTSFAPAESKSQAFDSDFGPKPRFTSWSPRGSNHAVFITWECTVLIPQTCLAPEFREALAEYNYSMSWSIDQSSRTIRTTNVTMEIPMTRKSSTSRLTPDTIDKFRREVDVPTIKFSRSGFHRSSNWSMTADKRTMTISIVDTEIPSNNPYFPGMIKMDITHSVNSQGSALIPGSTTGSNQLWTNRISGRVEVAPHADKALGWTAIQHVINARMGIAKNALKETQFLRDGTGLLRAAGVLATTSGNPVLKAAALTVAALAAKPTIETQVSRGLKIITSLSIQEELYGQGISFSVEYVVASGLDELFGVTGLFSPIPGDWRRWRTSLDLVDFRRGFANMSQFQPDVIVDLCIDDRQEIPSFVFESPELKNLPFGETPSNIPTSKNWLNYENAIQLISDANTSDFRPLSSDISETTKGISDLEGKNTEGRIPVPEVTSKQAATIQIKGPPTTKILMLGQASRAGSEASPPVLVSVGGVKATVVNKNNVAYRKKDTFSRIPIFTTVWAIEYFIDTVPTLKPRDIIIAGGDPEAKTQFFL